MVEPGGSVFGGIIREMVGRFGARVISVEAIMCQSIDPDKVNVAYENQDNAKFVAIVHAEATYVRQSLEEILEIAKSNGSLLKVDVVTSFIGNEL